MQLISFLVIYSYLPVGARAGCCLSMQPTHSHSLLLALSKLWSTRMTITLMKVNRAWEMRLSISLLRTRQLLGDCYSGRSSNASSLLNAGCAANTRWRTRARA
jgi:hypothetical protein